MPVCEKPDSSYINDGGWILRAGVHKKMVRRRRREGGMIMNVPAVLTGAGARMCLYLSISSKEEIGLASIIFKWVKT